MHKLEFKSEQETFIIEGDLRSIYHVIINIIIANDATGIKDYTYLFNGVYYQDCFCVKAELDYLLYGYGNGKNKTNKDN